MPPKPKFSKEEITAAALGVVAEKGAEALTAKELGQALGTSTRPIFTFFSTMQEVREAVRDAAMQKFEAYTADEEDMPLFKQIGMKTVLFGLNEPKLYQLLFMQENRSAVTFDDIFDGLGNTAVLCIEELNNKYGLNQNQALFLFRNVWIYTFGIGALCATGGCSFSRAELSRLLSSEFNAMLMYIKENEGTALQ